MSMTDYVDPLKNQNKDLFNDKLNLKPSNKDIKMAENVNELVGKENYEKIEISKSKNYRYNLEEMIDVLTQEQLTFSFIDHLKNICHIQKKNSVFLYEKGMQSLDLIMDIETYIKLHFDMKIIKAVLLDHKQNNVLSTLNRMIDFKTIFDKDEKKNYNYSNYLTEEEHADFFNSLKIMFARNNSTDKKILHLIRSKFGY